MPSYSEHENCWIEIEDERYGPATCQLTTSVSSPGSQPRQSWEGVLTFEPDAQMILPGKPLSEDTTIVLILDDARRGNIGVTRTETSNMHGIQRVEFVGRGFLDTASRMDNQT